MTQQIRFPFELREAFFVSLQFDRKPQVPDPLTFGVSAAVKVVADGFPELRVHLRIETLQAEDSPLTFHAEVIGLFGLLQGQPVPDRSIIPEFVNERALFLLWPYVSQTVRQITAQMGISPVRLPTPIIFEPIPDNTQHTPNTEPNKADKLQV